MLGRVRRGLPKASAKTGSPDVLLEKLSQMIAASDASGQTERDERGVVVVLKKAFQGDALKPEVADHLADLDRVAAAHPRFPVAVVVHTDKPIAAAERAKWASKGSSVLSLFKSVDPGRKSVVIVDDAIPLVPRTSPERADNVRVEIVFIAPEAL